VLERVLLVIKPRMKDAAIARGCVRAKILLSFDDNKFWRGIPFREIQSCDESSYTTTDNGKINIHAYRL
jgi:hypothetical protein